VNRVCLCDGGGTGAQADYFTRVHDAIDVMEALTEFSYEGIHIAENYASRCCSQLAVTPGARGSVPRDPAVRLAAVDAFSATALR
jgi:hypothetical protein